MNKSVITLERMNKSLIYLAETDEECGRLRSEHARAEFAAKSIYNTFFIGYVTGSVADRKARAESEPLYIEAKNREFDSFFAYEAMKNKRSTESIVIDTWRSVNAARNKGQII